MAGVPGSANKKDLTTPVGNVPPSAFTMRPILKSLAIHAAYSPIETIVFFSVFGIFAYLHILNTLKQSAFFAPPAPVRPAYALYTDEWLHVRESLWFRDDQVPRLDLQQIIFSGQGLEIASLENVTQHIAAAHEGFAHLQAGPQGWTQTIQVHSAFSLRSLPADSWGIAYEMDAQGQAIAELRSGNWASYALRMLSVRFYELEQVRALFPYFFLLS